MDLKYYSEVTIAGAKNLNSNRDNHFFEKYETLKLLDSKYKCKHIYYNKSLNSFIVIFRPFCDESDVFHYLGKLKNNTKGIQFDLDIERNNEDGEQDYILKIEYELKKIAQKSDNV